MSAYKKKLETAERTRISGAFAPPFAIIKVLWSVKTETSESTREEDFFATKSGELTCFLK